MSESSLKQFYNLFVPSDLAGTIIRRNLKTLNPTNDPDKKTSDAIRFLSQLLIDTKEAVYGTETVIKKFNEFLSGDDGTKVKETFLKSIQFYHTLGPDKKLNGIDYEVDLTQALKIDNGSFKGTKTEPNLSVYSITIDGISQITRNIDDVTLFLNTIPTLEFSRCIPYLQCDFIFAFPPVNKGNKVDAPTIHRFLLGSNSPLDSDRIILGAQANLPDSPEARFKDVTRTRSGMEMFTSPQTLVNANFEDNFTAHSTPIIDKFRPFMSIENFSAEVIPTQGLYANKRAKLSIVLHDRSRLADIAPLIKPDVLGSASTQIEITYGWNHPGLFGDNPYGDLINNCRTKEIFTVINSSFTFDQVGQVKIELDLCLIPYKQIVTTQITESSEFSNSLKKIEEIKSIITELRKKINLSTPGGGSAEVRPIKVLEAAQLGQLPNFNAKEASALKTSLNALKALIDKKVKSNVDIEGAAQDLKEALDALYGNDGKGGIIDKIKSSAQKSFQDKFNRIELVNPDEMKKKGYTPPPKQPFEKIDPFLFKKGNNPTPREDIIPVEVGKEIVRLFGTSTKTSVQQTRMQVVSLAKLLLIFVAEPLSTNNSAEEIQLVFYKVNDYAGFAGGMPLSSFPIEVDYLKKVLSDKAEKKRSQNFTISEFIDIINQYFINDDRTPAYGFSELYVKRTGIDDPPKIDPHKKDKIEDTSKRIMNGKQGTFQKPHLECYAEMISQFEDDNATFSEIIDSQSTSQVTDSKKKLKTTSTKQILRVHIYDKQASSNLLYSELLSASTDKALEKINQFKQLSPSEIRRDPFAAKTQVEKEVAQLALLGNPNNNIPGTSTRLIDGFNTIDKISNKDSNDVLIYGGGRAFKTFLRSAMPSLIYGSNNSAIKDASLSSRKDELQSTVNIQHAGAQGHLEPNGAGFGGLPTTIYPVELEMTTIGCPLLHINQQFFIDFGTGTSVDNIYNITKLSLELSPGKFESKISCVPLDAYGRYQGISDKIKQLSDELGLIKQRLSKGSADEPDPPKKA